MVRVAMNNGCLLVLRKGQALSVLTVYAGEIHPRLRSHLAAKLARFSAGFSVT